MRERSAGDGDAEFGRVGEVGQRHPPGLGRLAEDHVAGGAVQRPPVAHPPLQRPADAIIGESVRVDHLQVAQQRHRLHGGVTLGNGAPTLRLALRRQARIGIDPAPGALAEPGSGSGDALAVTLAVLHVGSHLLVGDGFARHDGTSVWTTEIPVVPARSGQHTRPSPKEDERARRPAHRIRTLPSSSLTSHCIVAAPSATCCASLARRVAHVVLASSACRAVAFLVRLS